MSLHCNKVVTIDFAPHCWISINTWYMDPRRVEALRWPSPKGGYPWLPPGTDRVPYPESEKGIFGVDIPDCHQEPAVFLILSQREEYLEDLVRISLTVTRNRQCFLPWVREGNIRWDIPDCHQEPTVFLILGSEKGILVRTSLTATRNRPCSLSWVRERNICNIWRGYRWLLPGTGRVPYPKSQREKCFEYLVRISLTAKRNGPWSLFYCKSEWGIFEIIGEDIADCHK